MEHAATLLSLSLSLFFSGAAAQDPASSWLAYTISEGNGELVTLVNATWKVPSYPNQQYGGNAPGWWYGIEPTAMNDLIQPILAWGDGAPQYTIFNGRFTWAGMNWWQVCEPLLLLSLPPHVPYNNNPPNFTYFSDPAVFFTKTTELFGCCEARKHHHELGSLECRPIWVRYVHCLQGDGVEHHILPARFGRDVLERCVCHRVSVFVLAQCGLSCSHSDFVSCSCVFLRSGINRTRARRTRQMARLRSQKFISSEAENRYSRNGKQSSRTLRATPMHTSSRRRR
jgi:hypothetical protein